MARVTGVKETTRNFRRAAGMLAAPLNSAARQALEPTLEMIKATAPLPALRRDAKLHRVKGSPRTAPRYRIGFVGLGQRLAHLKEFGTQPHSLKKGASVRKGIFVGEAPMHPGDPPRPFVRPAFDATRNGMARIFANAFWPAWVRHLRRLEARQARRARGR